MSVPSAVTSANNSDSQSPLVETVNVVIQDVRWESVPSSAEEALNSATILPIVPEPEVGGAEETVLSTTETITIGIEITSVPVEHEVGGHAISKVADESDDQPNDDDEIFDPEIYLQGELIERGPYKKVVVTRPGPPPPATLLIPQAVSGQAPPPSGGQTANTSTHQVARPKPTAAVSQKQGSASRKQYVQRCAYDL
ncbi:hypothetical protein PHLCEN_2v462 [Hermanssonia centrifuga]|uniref:Uncharacterized protein n=1 Tax=Hermanssonia centrifuga TaxID=98765 RepID=A0A2R6S5T6_9APHY|nr:hypothetical protein PHLCEN_2v462 [Hermanssonia centrifuga]